MFREMRRKGQQLSREETIQILERGTSGTLALLGDGGYPYALPISYVYSGGRLFFHSAVAGHKVDAIRACEKASFCVIDQDRVVAEEYTTYFRSAVVFGKIRRMEGAGEARAAIETLAEKYAPGRMEERKAVIERESAALCMLELEIEHMTGKEAAELARERK